MDPTVCLFLMVFSCFPFRMSINVTTLLPLPVASMFGSCGFQVMSKLMPGVWILYAPLCDLMSQVLHRRRVKAFTTLSTRHACNQAAKPTAFDLWASLCKQNFTLPLHTQPILSRCTDICVRRMCTDCSTAQPDL